MHVGVRCDDGGRQWATISVSDTGPGIAKDRQRLVFDEFTRLATSRDVAGAGIGLSISQRLAGALGGRITVDSELGQGSTFTLWLPLQVAQSTATA